MSDKIVEYVYMARLAEQMERFEDMVDYMKKVVDLTKDLKDEERNLLSVSFKNVVGQRRTAWRAICAYEMKEKTKGSHHIEVTLFYKQRLETELQSYCNEIINMIDKNLLKKTTPNEAQVFYLKMKADYLRYIAEISHEDLFNKAKEEAKRNYESALNLARKELRATNAIRLGTALNFSVFYYEIANSIADARSIANSAFEEAINELENIDSEQYKDSTTILQLIKDNLTQWIAESNEEGEETELKRQ